MCVCVCVGGGGGVIDVPWSGGPPDLYNGKQWGTWGNTDLIKFVHNNQVSCFPLLPFFMFSYDNIDVLI